MRYRHIAIFVPELYSAEGYYREIFQLDVIVREARVGRGLEEWAQLPRDKGWADAEAAGIEMGMVALGRDDFVLALFTGEPSPVQVYAIGVVVTEAEMAGVASRLPDDTRILGSEPNWLDFIDRHQFHWQLATGSEFRGSGDRNGLWLNV